MNNGVALHPIDAAIVARIFACPNPARMNWCTFAESGAECRGCSGMCGTTRTGLFHPAVIEQDLFSINQIEGELA